MSAFFLAEISDKAPLVHHSLIAGVVVAVVVYAAGRLKLRLFAVLGIVVAWFIWNIHWWKNEPSVSDLIIVEFGRFYYVKHTVLLMAPYVLAGALLYWPSATTRRAAAQ